jgi:hypothetical protein
MLALQAAVAAHMRVLLAAVAVHLRVLPSSWM